MVGGETPSKKTEKVKQIKNSVTLKEEKVALKNNQEFDAIFYSLKKEQRYEKDKTIITIRKEQGSDNQTISIIKEWKFFGDIESKVSITKVGSTYNLWIEKDTGLWLQPVLKFFKSYLTNEETNYYQYNRVQASDITPFLEAIKARIKDMKESSKNRFIELSVNEDKKDADNLIENIEEQTA